MISQDLENIFLKEAEKHASQIIQGFLKSAIKSGNFGIVMNTAAMFGAPDLLKSVMAHHQSTSELYVSALHNAAIDGHVECVQLLWDKVSPSAHEGYRILTRATLNKHFAVAHYALDKGVDPNNEDQDLLCLCAFNQYYELAERLLEKCDSSAALSRLHTQYVSDYHKWQWFDEMIAARAQKEALQNILQPIKNTRSNSKM